MSRGVCRSCATTSAPDGRTMRSPRDAMRSRPYGRTPMVAHYALDAIRRGLATPLTEERFRLSRTDLLTTIKNRDRVMLCSTPAAASGVPAATSHWRHRGVESRDLVKVESAGSSPAGVAKLADGIACNLVGRLG